MNSENNKNIRPLSPSEFYRMRRPEYFSDSEISYEVTLPREHLAYELQNITTNQKQDEFEMLCRRLAELLVAPNLIPQVGPTGGGDGKTDTETYPVSSVISDRWFVPENGWSRDEKWAFAISAKRTWKSKLKSDVEKIIGTQRGYTRIYFMTNQTPSSKKKKDAQDALSEEFGVDIIILDGVWILDKIYNSDLIDLAVDSLNLSTVYQKQKTVLGKNDTSRSKKLSELEEKISNPNRYFEYDFQLVEDALEAAILSRMLEKPRDEVEGKFDRAERFCKKVNNPQQWSRVLYQRAWTSLNWYDDYSSFIDQFKEFKEYIKRNSSISEMELYYNLFNLLRALHNSEKCDLSSFGIDFHIELEELKDLLLHIEKNERKPCSALIAKTYSSIQGLMDEISSGDNPDRFFVELAEYLRESIKFLEYPFDSFKNILEELGNILPGNHQFDALIDTIALISEQRNSELAAGETFLKRGGQKLSSDFYKESIVYFGKAILKLAKEESKDGMYYSLIGLSEAYSSLGLLWAANNCLVSACSMTFRTWYESGAIDKRTYRCAKQLTINELFIGRIPSFLTWYELLLIISRQSEINQKTSTIQISELIDACFSIRLLHSDPALDNSVSLLPDILEELTLWLSQNACWYKLGYTDLILKDYKGIGIDSEEELDSYFKMVADQPFQQQMTYDTNFLSDDRIQLTSRILGCKITLKFGDDKELLLAAETLLAFLEGFFATSLSDVCPCTEEISIILARNKRINNIKFVTQHSPHQYKVEVNLLSDVKSSMDEIRTTMFELISRILSKEFIINNPNEYIENLFKYEEVQERIHMVFQHRKLTIDILGNNPKILFKDWKDKASVKAFPSKRSVPITFPISNTSSIDMDRTFDPNTIGHDKRKVISIIETDLWEKAKWNGFGFFGDPSSMGIFIAFKNEGAGINIFENWIQRVGKEDRDDLIRISIIRGVDKNNPFWYRVHITNNIDSSTIESGKFFITASKYHEMNATDPSNLSKLIELFNYYNSYYLCPAKFIHETQEIKPYVEKSILKRSLIIKNAWEIGEHDPDIVVIRKDDNPIIPDNTQDVPVLKLLNHKSSS